MAGEGWVRGLGRKVSNDRGCRITGSVSAARFMANLDGRRNQVTRVLSATSGPKWRTNRVGVSAWRGGGPPPQIFLAVHGNVQYDVYEYVHATRVEDPRRIRGDSSSSKAR